MSTLVSPLTSTLNFFTSACNVMAATARTGVVIDCRLSHAVKLRCSTGMSRYDLSDFEWRVMEPLLPNKPRGVPRVDDRRVLNGIFWVLRSGAPWRDRSGALWSAYHLLQPLRPMAKSRRMGPADG